MANLVRITLRNTTNRPVSFRHITDDPVAFPPDPASVDTYTIDLTLEQFATRPLSINYSYWNVKSGQDITEMTEPQKDSCDAEMKTLRDTSEINTRKTNRDKIGGTKTDLTIESEVNAIPFNRLNPGENPPTSTP